jgi:hypothetical protein
MPQKKLSKTRQKIHEVYEENELACLKQNQTRGRSLSVGTAGGGVVELNMRGDFANLWYQMQPTEVIEIIGQLAAATGIEIAMRPRQDFASWRSWDPTLPANVAWMGAAPWQLSEEDRALLAEYKAKNIKSIEASDESKSE